MGKLLRWEIKKVVEMIVLMLLNKYDLVCLVDGSRGIGKCQIKGNKVLMKDGSWKNIENIKKGDEIISPQKDGLSMFAKVIETHNRFEEDIYEVREVTRNKSLLYTCSGNHSVPIYRISRPRIKGSNKRKSKQILDNWEAQRIAKTYTKGSHYVSFSTTTIEYNQPNSSIEPYSLGVFLGDGSFSSRIDKNKTKSRGLSITSMDFEILKEISKNYPIMNIHNKKGTPAKKYSFSLNGEFANELIKLGLEGKGSGEKFIPKECLLSSIKYRWKLLAGLIDTDGYVNKKINHISITTKSNQLAEDIKNLVFSLGGHSSIRKITKSSQTGFQGEYNEVKISFENPKLIPLLTSKKQKLGNKMKHNPRHIAIKCIKGNPQQVYGFEIDSPSKWYITDNWMVTHNSTLCIVLARRVSAVFNKLKRFDEETIMHYWEKTNRKLYPTLDDFLLKIIELRDDKSYKFKMRKDIIYTRNHVIKAFNDWRRIVVADEQVNVAFNRDFYNEDQKDLIKIMNMNRDHNICYFGAIPSFSNMDTQIKGLTKLRLTVLRRGLALVQTPTKSMFSTDKWNVNYNQRLEQEWLKKKVKNPHYAKLTTVRGILSFPDLPKSLRNIYEEVKNNERNVIAKEQFGITGDDGKVKLTPTQEMAQRLIENGVKNVFVLEGYALGNNLKPEAFIKAVSREIKKMGKDPALSNYYWDERRKKGIKAYKNADKTSKGDKGSLKSSKHGELIQAIRTR